MARRQYHQQDRDAATETTSKNVRCLNDHARIYSPRKRQRAVQTRTGASQRRTALLKYLGWGDRHTLHTTVASSRAGVRCGTQLVRTGHPACSILHWGRRISQRKAESSVSFSGARACARARAGVAWRRAAGGGRCGGAWRRAWPAISCICLSAKRNPDELSCALPLCRGTALGALGATRRGLSRHGVASGAGARGVWRSDWRGCSGKCATLVAPQGGAWVISDVFPRCSSSASGAAGNMYSARRPGAWDGRLDCSAPAILLRAKKSEVLLTAQISE